MAQTIDFIESDDGYKCHVSELNLGKTFVCDHEGIVYVKLSNVIKFLDTYCKSKCVFDIGPSN